MIDPLSHPIADNTEQQIKYPKSKSKVGSLRNGHGGLTLFQIDTKTHECEKVPLNTATIPIPEKSGTPLPKAFTGNLSERSQLVIQTNTTHYQVEAKEGFYYVWALNKKNALRRYRKAFKLR